ncbi:MAG: ABC transporter ATP-binding protein [Burkholderiaceae bacterium]
MPPSTVNQALPKHGIHLREVSLVRGASTVFDGLSLELTEARIGLIGDNGAGKSSLFRLICGLDSPRAGRVEACGEPVNAEHPVVGRVGLMFQNADEQIIFPTVEEELALSLTATGVSRRVAVTQARDWLAARGLADWAPRAVGSLSQGQRQYVCWLALVIAAPQVLLLDEPFASLDLPGQARLRSELARASQQLLVSTHVLHHVSDYERVIWLDHGRVRADGPGHEVCAVYEADVMARVASGASVN